VLTKRGVEIITGVGVEAIEADAVVLADGQRIPARTVVWTAGVRASPLASLLGVELTRGGRIAVDAHFAVPGRPGVYAVGDIAANPDAPLPQVAQPAIQAGDHVARRILGRDESFRYRDKGAMATIGRHAAVTELPGGRRLTGPIGWLAWLGLHLVYLMGFRNRASVLLTWAWNYLTYDRAARLLTGQSVDRVLEPD
jgi:NADH dehydrogenase